MITIKSRPYDLLTPKINPVYNGLPFVVDSDRKNRSNFRYICKPYVDGQLITELRHNPDISASNYGIFDIGRVVENYMSFDNWTLDGYTPYDATRTAKPYYVELGEEYGRVVEITSIYATTGGSYVKTKYPHNLRAGDRFLIQGSTIPDYNGYKSVVAVASNNLVRISTTFVGTPDLSLTYLVEGEKIIGFTSQTINNVQYLRVAVNMNNSSTSNWSRFNIGDIVMINQDSVTYQFYENTEWSIIAKSAGTWLGQPVMFYTLNAPYKGPISSTIFGSIISRDNYVFQNLVSTKLDKSIAFNGVLQYNDYLDWNPSKYVFGSASNGEFLSNKPSLTTNLCSTDHYTLTSFARQTNGSNATITTETWSTPSIGLRSGSATQSSNVLSSGSTSLRFTIFNGNDTTYYGVGDYITITNLSGGNPVSGRVVRVVYSSPNTIIYTDITSTIPFINGYIEQTIRVRYRIIAQSTIGMATQIPCGPANYNYTEFTNGTCYKYFVYGSIPKSTSYYDAMNRYWKTSETWTFNIECPCDRYKSYHIAWLNECGGLDYYKFNMRSDKSLTIEKSIYEKKLPSVQSNMGYKYKTGDRGRQIYNTKSVETIVARTNFLTQSELDWIKYIYESPEVYWVDDVNNKLVPVNITETSVEEPNKLNRGEAGSLYIYTITMEMANDRVIQRGGNIKSITGGINNVLVPFTYTYNRY